MEAAQVWNLCMQTHKQTRMAHGKWPGGNELHQITKGQFALHSQSVQQIFRAFLATIETTRALRKTHPQMKYPWRTMRYYPFKWPAQAVHKEKGRVILPMGKGHKSLVLPLELPENSGACTLVWNHGFELHVCVEVAAAATAPGKRRATVDLGEIHLAAVTTDASNALIVTGRGIRSLKRQRNQQLGKLAKKQSRCKKYSRRWKNLQRAKNKQCRRAERRIHDLRHKAARQIIDFCVEHKVGTLFIGNPHGVRNRDTGRHHNHRMAGWEYGKDIDYLTHKAKQAHIMSFTGSERGTSSRCPVCGHRDLVGSVNMHQDAFDTHLKFPRSFTYLRPGSSRSSSRADTPRSCLSESVDQALLSEQVSKEATHPTEVAQKLIPFRG
jgi:putative transposase